MSQKIYLANGTMQNMVYWFRDPSNGRVRSVEISNRRQALIGEYDGDHLRKVIEHMEQFGAVESNEAPNLQSLFGLVYHVEQPVKSDDINYAVLRNREVAQKVSEQEAENAGVALFRVAGRDQETSDTVRTTEMEVIQLDEFGSAPRRDGVNFSVEVSKRNNGRQEGRRRAG